jgi:sulfide:quinone oxidoreductase
MRAEFTYNGEPKETFGNLLGIDQATPRRALYYLKRVFFFSPVGALLVDS